MGDRHKWKNWTPSDLGVSAVDLQTDTTYTSGLIDLREFDDFWLEAAWVETGTTTAGS